MIPPADTQDTLSPEILVPVPEEDQLLRLAYERACAGIAWEGTTPWHWPAKFTPARVQRDWSDKEITGILWDGIDETGRRIGGTMNIEAGWHERSTLAQFEIGCFGIWRTVITWRPRPYLIETIAGEEIQKREIDFRT
jgi:hypothetical protein